MDAVDENIGSSMSGRADLIERLIKETSGMESFFFSSSYMQVRQPVNIIYPCLYVSISNLLSLRLRQGRLSFLDAQDVKNHGKSLHLASVTLSASILFQLSITKMTKSGHRSQFSNAATSGQTIATFNKLVELNEGDLCERFVFYLAKCCSVAPSDLRCLFCRTMASVYLQEGRPIIRNYATRYYVGLLMKRLLAPDKPLVTLAKIFPAEWDLPFYPYPASVSTKAAEECKEPDGAYTSLKEMIANNIRAIQETYLQRDLVRSACGFGFMWAGC